MCQIAAAKGGNAVFDGEVGHAGVAIPAIDALPFQDDAFLLEFGQAEA